jgi:hypothetical protein
MQTVIIISKCTRVIKLKTDETWYEFHFKGVCSGVKLSKIMLRSKELVQVFKDEEYLIYVGVISHQGGILKGDIIKIKNLENCRDQS